MTMGLKIHRMLKDERKDSPEMVQEAKKRKELSDNILELIYNKLTSKGKTRDRNLEEQEEEAEDEEELV
jgi:hypothetical protein